MEHPPGRGLETHSLKKKRVYVRKFDHEEARRLHEAGESTYALAKRFGVSENAVHRVVDLAYRAKLDAQSKRWIHRTKRKPCLGGCGKLVWVHTKERTGYCHVCLTARNVAWTVREDTLFCRRCEQWKPDADFPWNRKNKGKLSRPRRGRDPWCRACATKVRRLFRQGHPEQAKRENQRVMIKRREAKVADYIVLRKVGEKDYIDVGVCEAPSPDIAVEKVATEEGEYVGVLTSRFEVVEVAPTTSLRVQRESK